MEFIFKGMHFSGTFVETRCQNMAMSLSASPATISCSWSLLLNSGVLAIKVIPEKQDDASALCLTPFPQKSAK